MRQLLAGLALLCGAAAQASVGLSQIQPPGSDDPVTLFYPSSAPAQMLRRGVFELALAPEGAPQPGNGLLVVISHGSGGSPWVFANLARALVEAGYVVALPQHHADNYRDPGSPGPASWTLRPAEVSRAIDAVAADPRFSLDLSRVGVYGMSAGGHTALSLAGGRWSPALFNQHCQAHLEQDFHTCVGLATRLTGSWLDGVRKGVARLILRWRFAGDAELRSHHDPRIAAVVAGVPAAADFDPASLAEPAVPLALVTAGQDLWLHPQFHSSRILAACLPRCEHLADLPQGGHGALLSPLPPGLTGLIGELLNDPPGFERSALPALDRRIVDFFDRRLRPQGATSVRKTG